MIKVIHQEVARGGTMISPTASTSDTNLTPSIKTDTNKLAISNNLRQQQTQTPIMSFQRAAADSEGMPAQPNVGQINSPINLFRSNSTSSISSKNESAFAPTIIADSKIEDIGDNFEESGSSARMATIDSHFFEGVEKLLEVIWIWFDCNQEFIQCQWFDCCKCNGEFYPMSMQLGESWLEKMIPGLVLHPECSMFRGSWLCYCETQRFPDQKLSSSIFTCRLSSVRPASVTSPLISTIWCFRPYKPNIFWKLMTPTIHWPIDHSPITHTDPPNPPRTQPTWPFLHFMTFCSIQAIYFLKTHGIHYPLAHRIDHFPITHIDPSDPPLHGIAWPSESRIVVQRLIVIVLMIPGLVHPEFWMFWGSWPEENPKVCINCLLIVGIS